MSKSLAELRKSKPASLPTRVVTVCLDLEVLAEVQRLEGEKSDLHVELQGIAASSASQSRPNPRVAAINARVAEIDDELTAKFDRMRESEGELLLRATSGGAWQRWKDDHPAREDNKSDEAIAYGFCNASDLLDDLSKYVVEWNGEPFGKGDWDELFADRVAPADLRAICSLVVEMHEVRAQVPKSRSVSSELLTSATDSPSPDA